MHHHALPGFESRIARHPNAVWHGPYDRQDLAAIYGSLDAVWGQDLWQSGANSDWLLPNRLYEAGYFGCPVIAVAGTETAAWVARHGTGWVIDAARPEALLSLLARLDATTIFERKRHILTLPASLFATDGADAAAMVAPLSRMETRHAQAAASA